MAINIFPNLTLQLKSAEYIWNSIIIELKLKIPDATIILDCMVKLSKDAILIPLEISNIPVTISLYVVLEDMAHIKVESTLKIVVKLKMMASVFKVSNMLHTI